MVLYDYKNKIFGLLIDLQCLLEICNECCLGSKYVVLENCCYEVNEVELMMWCEGVKWLLLMYKLIEEIVMMILQDIKMDYNNY